MHHQSPQFAHPAVGQNTNVAASTACGEQQASARPATDVACGVGAISTSIARSSRGSADGQGGTRLRPRLAMRPAALHQGQHGGAEVPDAWVPVRDNEHYSRHLIRPDVGLAGAASGGHHRTPCHLQPLSNRNAAEDGGAEAKYAKRARLDADDTDGHQGLSSLEFVLDFLAAAQPALLRGVATAPGTAYTAGNAATAAAGRMAAAEPVAVQVVAGVRPAATAATPAACNTAAGATNAAINDDDAVSGRGMDRDAEEDLNAADDDDDDGDINEPLDDERLPPIRLFDVPMSQLASVVEVIRLAASAGSPVPLVLIQPHVEGGPYLPPPPPPGCMRLLYQLPDGRVLTGQELPIEHIAEHLPAAAADGALDGDRPPAAPPSPSPSPSSSSSSSSSAITTLTTAAAPHAAPRAVAAPEHQQQQQHHRREDGGGSPPVRARPPERELGTRERTPCLTPPLMVGVDS